MIQRVLLLLFVASSAAAQSRPGLTFDQIVRGGTADDTSTHVIHMTAAGPNIRMEFENGPRPGQFKGIPLGNHGIVIMRDGGAEIIMIDPDKKEYMSVKPAEIDGHATIRYRLTARTKVNATMMGETHTMENNMTWETQNAPDLNEFDDVVAATAGLKMMVQSMGLPKDYFDRAIPKEHKMRGFPLHSERQMIMIADGTTRITAETIDTKNIRRTSVPDSAFAVPTDYKSVALPFGPPSPKP